MGKVSRKKPDGSHGSSSKNSKMGPIASTSSASSGLSLSAGSSGRISKASKKSVTFRSNLTDVASSSSGLMMAPSSTPNVMSLVNSMDSSASGAMNLSHLGKTIKKDVKGKKSRMKIKREAFQKKIDLIKKVETDEKEAQKRRQTPIVGDTKALMDALPVTITNSQPQQQQGPSTSNGVFNPLGALAGFVESHNLEEFKTLPKRKFNTKQREKEIREGLEYFAAALNCQPPVL